ncbi:hypothetical protein HOT99_gp132 [Caulobacter phage CcrBL10]|uniref:Uncharacterized protein n=1 Tax=Caulobacter phage CcrBL10 TaxID=2283269 RepID=A0A385EBW6_9CAUD|nr:hypothetical protein HOT99_gp132 [Caulobacter phage CcrBL10]AXQ68485.1 hypothetical protein CcrBL10_gp281 [Caulobacter phage CcrBL10]
MGFVSSTPEHFRIVDLKVVDDSLRTEDGKPRMFAREADPYMKVPPWVEFQIVLGCFDTFEEAYEALKKSRDIWSSDFRDVVKAERELQDANRAVRLATAALERAESDRRAACREPFLGTPTEYR